MAADLRLMILCDPFLCIAFVYLFVSVSPTESASVSIVVLRSRLENTARFHQLQCRKVINPDSITNI